MKTDFRKFRIFEPGVVSPALTVIFVALVAVLVIQADGPQDDIRNGWYPQLPPISRAELDTVISCLVANGAPPNPQVFSEQISNVAGGPSVAPTQLVWKKNGAEVRTDAVLTYYSPAVAYHDMHKTFGLPAQWFTCATTSSKILVSVLNPVGAPYPEKCATCARSASGDMFETNATFTDNRGTWIKRRGWNMFFPYGWWERQ